GGAVDPLLDHVPAAVALPLPLTAEILAVSVRGLRGVQVDLRARRGPGAAAHAAGDLVVTPHVPGAEPGAVMPAALSANGAAVQARQLPALAEVKSVRELEVVAQVQLRGRGPPPRAGAGGPPRGGGGG